MPFSNIFDKKFDNLINNFNKHNIIQWHQTKNARNPQLLDRRRNSVTDDFKI